jgi:periplasmic copper chaperone A
VPHHDPARRLPAAALATSLLLAGCGGDTPPDVDDSGAVGPDTASADVEVLQVQVEHPLDGGYEAGEDARLFLGLANDSTREDELVEVRGPDFADAALRVDGEASVINVPPGEDLYIGPEASLSVVLEDLRTPLRAAESIPVTFVFEETEEVTVDAVVATEGQDPTSPFDAPDPAEGVAG